MHYRIGEENPADYMSRHPSTDAEPCSRQEKVAEEYVNYIATTSTPTALTLSMVAETTGRDPTLRAVMDAVRSGRWYNVAKHPTVDPDTFRTYERLKDELTVGTTTQVIIRGTKLVIPKELQRRVVDLAHEGHQGITKTKALLREKVWFPGINKMVEERVKSCLACQVATPGKAPATAFFNRQLRTKLPEVHTDVRDPAKIQETDQNAKGKMKQYADSKAYVRPSGIQRGDTLDCHVIHT